MYNMLTSYIYVQQNNYHIVSHNHHFFFMMRIFKTTLLATFNYTIQKY